MSFIRNAAGKHVSLFSSTADKIRENAFSNNIHDAVIHSGHLTENEKRSRKVIYINHRGFVLLGN